jgi:cytochrome c oxidase subunit 2
MRRWLSVSALALGGCGTDIQSVLAPHGAQAGKIATLAWALFAFGTVVLLIVVVATWLAMRGSTRLRALLARDRTILALGLALPAITLSVLLGYGVFLMRAQLGPNEAGAMRIEVVGERWWWRVTYETAGGRVASATEIRIPVGRPVTFTLKSADVIHSFWVPSLGGKVDMIPGRTTHLRLTAERAGTYRGQCAEYCGGAHALMALAVIAMPPAEFDDWLAREAAPARVPAGEPERRSGALFLAAGCGSCHMVRGTPASGLIGPDLTHLGSRRSVGIDTLPLDAPNLVAFITDGQHIKPGNTMPPFRNLQADDAASITAYLLSLR